MTDKLQHLVRCGKDEMKKWKVECKSCGTKIKFMAKHLNDATDTLCKIFWKWDALFKGPICPDCQ